MIVNILNGSISEKVGNKAKLLMIMGKSGFAIPGGIVLDKDTYTEIVVYNKKENLISYILQNVDKANLKEASIKLTSLFENFTIPDHILEEIKNQLKSGVKYAVRSSGLKEDLDDLSFAGQYATFLNRRHINEIGEAVIGCYQSMVSEGVLSYLINHNIDIENLEMAVIIQEMVNSDKSGIAFTVNPLTGNDKEIVVEVAEGLGENIVSGRVSPERYTYYWFDSSSHYDHHNKLLTFDEFQYVARTALAIQMHFGYPCDIEFAFEKGNLFILQSRPVTRIMYSRITDQWTTADFKDGGVSATVCTSYMWSLYEYIWEISLKEFFLDSKLLKEQEIRKLGDMFYGRPYWNMSVVKNAMARVPGYKERDFDSDLGVKITYEGDGKTTGFTIKSIARIVKIALAQKKIVSKRNKKAQHYKDDLLQIYNSYLADYGREYSLKDLESLWYKLTKVDYLRSEGTYFRQIFINTVHQAIIKGQLLKFVGNSNYLNLLGGLENVSHLLPFYDMWEIGKKIVLDREASDFWRETSVTEIRDEYDENSEEYFLPEFKEFINKYGYHSDKELDVTYPCYYEDINGVIKKFKEVVLLNNTQGDINDREKQALVYKAELWEIQKTTKPQKYKKLLKKVEKMRNMLWWREEFRDISTRYYFLIRVYTVRLAETYVKEHVLENVDDVWHLKVSDLWDFIDKKKTRDDIQSIITRNMKYFNSFRNFTSENEIGTVFDKESPEKKPENSTDKIAGTGCNNGTVTGKAKIINSLHEIDKLEVGDILVTKFTDTGWTSKFAILKGIVTEYGGVLCHAAIVSREYGIPCIVSTHNATKLIKDGSTLRINGSTGEITILDDQ